MPWAPAASRHDEHADDENDGQRQLECLEQEEPQRLQRRDDKQHDEQERGQRCQQRIASPIPQASQGIVHRIKLQSIVEF